MSSQQQEGSQINAFAKLIPSELLDESGKVFYAGREAFSGSKFLYLLGFNPGGDPVKMATETPRLHTNYVLNEAPDMWSAYRDEPWNGRPAGTCGLQPRVRYLFDRLGLDPRSTPASNIIFSRSRRVSSIRGGAAYLAEACWRFHQAVMAQLGVRVIVCFGRDAGNWVCARLNATRQVGEFVEKNKRGWRSRAFVNSGGMTVLALAHPSVADWTNPATDPAELVLRAMDTK